MEKYLDAIRKNVCSICVDSDENGECRLTEKELCAVESYLKEIIELAENMTDEYYDKYYENLREKICANCRAKSADGNCYLRDDANCALDRYFPLVVETVRKVRNS